MAIPPCIKQVVSKSLLIYIVIVIYIIHSLQSHPCLLSIIHYYCLTFPPVLIILSGYKGHLDVLDLLVRRGADFWARNGRQENATDYSRKGN